MFKGPSHSKQWKLTHSTVTVMPSHPLCMCFKHKEPCIMHAIPFSLQRNGLNFFLETLPAPSEDFTLYLATFVFLFVYANFCDRVAIDLTSMSNIATVCTI